GRKIFSPSPRFGAACVSRDQRRPRAAGVSWHLRRARVLAERDVRRRSWNVADRSVASELARDERTARGRLRFLRRVVLRRARRLARVLHGRARRRADDRRRERRRLPADHGTERRVYNSRRALISRYSRTTFGVTSA